jgi:phosphate starvation-inducible membrane PsiE
MQISLGSFSIDTQHLPEGLIWQVFFFTLYLEFFTLLVEYYSKLNVSLVRLTISFKIAERHRPRFIQKNKARLAWWPV